MAVHGDRNRDYGSPYENMDRTARMWSAYLGIPIRPDQVAWCMVLLKVARLSESPGHWDSQVDTAGWAAIGAEAYAEGEYRKDYAKHMEAGTW